MFADVDGDADSLVAVVGDRLDLVLCAPSRSVRTPATPRSPPRSRRLRLRRLQDLSAPSRRRASAGEGNRVASARTAAVAVIDGLCERSRLERPGIIANALALRPLRDATDPTKHRPQAVPVAERAIKDPSQGRDGSRLQALGEAAPRRRSRAAAGARPARAPREAIERRAAHHQARGAPQAAMQYIGRLMRDTRCRADRRLEARCSATGDDPHAPRAGGRAAVRYNRRTARRMRAHGLNQQDAVDRDLVSISDRALGRRVPGSRAFRASPTGSARR